MQFAFRSKENRRRDLNELLKGRRKARGIGEMDRERGEEREKATALQLRLRELRNLSIRNRSKPSSLSEISLISLTKIDRVNRSQIFNSSMASNNVTDTNIRSKIFSKSL